MPIAPFQLERYFAKYEFTTEFLLCSSDCEAMSIAELLSLEVGAAEKFQNTWLGYTESQGSPTLRDAICQIYTSMRPEDILVHSGAEEAIFLFMHAVLRADDHVIVHAPHYQSLSAVAESIGCQVSRWEAREEDGWALDPSELRQLLRPETKAIVLNTPHNPTGYLMSRVDFEAVNRFAKEHDLLLFVDEVYRESEHDPTTRLPAACDLGAHCVSLGVMSKTYGLAGLRIGWIATQNQDVYQKIAALKDYTTICNSAPSEFLAEVALRNRHKLIDRNLGILRNNLMVVDELFAQYSRLFEWARPRAGTMGFPKLRQGDVEEFCDRLVRTAGVLLLPGTLYGDTENHFRLGFGRRNLPQAVARLRQQLDRSQ